MKLFKNLFNLITAAGVILLIGTAGLSDNSAIQLCDIAPNAFTAVNIILFGVIGGKAVCLPKKVCKKVIKEKRTQRMHTETCKAS